jgi:LPXTG-motif cell wall-anchored protein
MSDALAPGATTSVITLVVEVDSTVASGTQILNQAMVHGAYAAGAVLSGIGAGSPTLSCVPVIASTVCDLSAQVSVPVSTPIVASSPPVSSVSVVVPELPRTGSDHLDEMLVFAFGGILLGGALLLGRRGAR